MKNKLAINTLLIMGLFNVGRWYYNALDNQVSIRGLRKPVQIEMTNANITFQKLRGQRDMLAQPIETKQNRI